MDALTILSTIYDEAKTKADPAPRRVAEHKVGIRLRHGDIYVLLVPADHPHGPMTPNRQLALGMTAGSRHMAEGPVAVYEGTTAPTDVRRPLLGPCVVATDRWQITHPEHATLDLPPGTYQITHQRDVMTDDRVRD